VLDGAQRLAGRLNGVDCREHGVRVLTGGTDVHLVLVDLVASSLDGQQAEDRLHSIGITVNRNAVPFDPRPPMITSGLRIGTPALASRGFDETDFVEVADVIALALAGELSDSDRQALAGRVRTLAARHPLYPTLGATTPRPATRLP
jgi:glycine hydroxymethyltransferase